jgi:long-subunit fatty acid transport protein
MPPRVLLALLALLVFATVSRAAGAAGYDTPILYTARHQGMGGTAIGGVNDPSATFHNPGGLAGVRGLALIGDLSLLLGKIHGRPERAVGDLDSEPVVAPFFLFGAGYRAHEWLSVGVGFFPIASGGAEYRYELAGNPFVDSTQILFLEVTPAVSLDVPKDEWIPGRLALGAGYRVNTVRFERKKGDPEDPRVLALDMSGESFSGFRVGAQYRPVQTVGIGAVFRNRVDLRAGADEVSVFTQTARDARLDFVLPAKLGMGVDLTLSRWRVAADLEYALQSQNDRVLLEGTLDGEPVAVPNVFDWRDGLTARVGVERRFGDGLRYPIRAGYAIDTVVTTRAYPTAFGTPPAPTHSLSAGAGLDAGSFQVNAAFVHRFGSTRVEEADLGAGCAFCGFAGRYSVVMNGLYLDASVDLEL